MDELVTLRNAMFKEFGEDAVRRVADREGFCIDIYPDALDDENVLEMFTEMINFLAEHLAEVSTSKTRAVLLQVGMSATDIEDVLYF